MDYLKGAIVMYEGVIVTHKKWGTGRIMSLSNKEIKVDFQGTEKEFVFPDSVGVYLQTTDSAFLEYAESEKIAKKKLEEETKPKTQTGEVKPPKKPTARGDYSDYESSLLGKRAEDISFPTKEEFFETLGYLAAPNRIAFYQAEVTEDKEYQFKNLFPDQAYSVIKTNYGKNGLVTKQGCQFRINLASISDCPKTLLRHVGGKNGRWAGRINRSKFALRLVQNHGFSFGYKQDEEAIKKSIPQEYMKDFLRGYNK